MLKITGTMSEIIGTLAVYKMKYGKNIKLIDLIKLEKERKENGNK